ncbi:hypothetical protein QH494_06255 [Sphingomonas sp. AR_OL41]|uniref:hypothetical protein n=1 Tax=Sphingomonas sp. AR_OL41 TaxID=3042729 RepID=UPI002480280A|nr:hypothetical protein [Sphingomonas sp. AR_OL41]MDH7971781.1 hypothetical protein [Sphingomonas sp. AR_OL41]
MAHTLLLLWLGGILPTIGISMMPPRTNRGQVPVMILGILFWPILFGIMLSTAWRAR